MDGAFFVDRSPPSAVIAEHLERLLAGLKRYEGVAAFDWHDYTSHPAAPAYEAWGQTYLELLGILAADPEIEVRTYGAETRTTLYRRLRD